MEQAGAGYFLGPTCRQAGASGCSSSIVLHSTPGSVCWSQEQAQDGLHKENENIINQPKLGASGNWAPLWVTGLTAMASSTSCTPLASRNWPLASLGKTEMECLL